MSVNTIFQSQCCFDIRARSVFLNAGTQHSRPHSSDYYEHDEIHQSFNLTQGNCIEVSSISGSVKVESIDGDVAEMHIIRSAKIKTDLAWRKTAAPCSFTSSGVSGSINIAAIDGTV